MTKSVSWLGRSRETVKGFVKSVRARFGYQLHRIQQGLMPTDYKPMPQVGAGVFEIRIHEPHEHRVIYAAKFRDKIYVFHAFEKKTRKTSKKDIEAAKKIYQDLVLRMKNVKLKE